MLEYESGTNVDQPTVTDAVGDSIDVVGSNNNAGATQSDESDDVEADSRCCSECSDEEDDSSEVWDSDGEVEDAGCDPGFWGDDIDDDGKNSEDGDSDQGSSRQDVSRAPSMKRTKTSHTVTEASPKKTSLSLLPTMSLDVLFEIFSHLSPLDIISLSRSSKVFHETLSSRNAPSVWKIVRKRFSAPDGPDWISEETWAELLFGTNCQSCSRNNTLEVDFLLLKRSCSSCKFTHYVSRSKVESRYPNFDFVVLLLPSTQSVSWNTTLSHYFYWNCDLIAMVSKLAALQKDADAQILHCFMEERKRRLQCIRQNSSSWHAWYLQFMQDRAQEEKAANERRLEQVKDKFKELGYIEEDLTFLRSRKECRGPGSIQMTAKIWSRIRPLLEPRVDAHKALRLERQLLPLRNKRRGVLAVCYKEFQRTLHPSQWKYLPRTEELMTYEGFSRLIMADVGVEVDGTTFNDAFLEFPKHFAAAAESRKTNLRASMGGTPGEDGEMGIDSIDLATAVFRCIQAHNHPRPFNYVFGWDEIASHHCLPDEWATGSYCPNFMFRHPLEPKYVPEIAVVVRRVAQLIGLDASTATAAHFDEKDKRFGCEACPRTKIQGRCLQIGYTWRNLAAHLETSKTHNPNLIITVLSDEEEKEMKQCERNDRKWDAKQWTCFHCSAYLDNLQHRQSIVEHLSASHGIQTPSEPTDLLFFERCRSDWTTTKFMVSATKPLKFRCLECVSTKDRLFMLKGVEDHLRSKHNILSGQTGIHCGTHYAFA